MNTLVEKDTAPKDVDQNIRMQISISEQSLNALNWLKLKIEATSYAEVIRRAVIFYDQLLKLRIDTNIPEVELSSEERAVRIQVVLTRNLRSRLDEMKNTLGEEASYSSVVRQALNTLYSVIEAQSNGEEIIFVKQGKDFKPNFPLAA